MNGVRRLRGLWCALKPAVPCGPSHFCTMRVSTLLSIVALALIPRGEARATYQRHARTTSDVCGDVDGPMKVVFLGVDVVVGPLGEHRFSLYPPAVAEMLCRYLSLPLRNSCLADFQYRREDRGGPGGRSCSDFSSHQHGTVDAIMIRMPCSFTRIQVNSAADHESCLYPDNATPFCSSGFVHALLRNIIIAL